MSELKELFNEMKGKSISFKEFKEAFVSLGSEPPVLELPVLVEDLLRDEKKQNTAKDKII